jgi:hypothetical protein
VENITIRNKLLLSLVAILFTFLGFWGISLLATAAAGRPLEQANSTKTLCGKASDQWQLGGKNLSNEKRKNHLTPTGRLMEGDYTN